MKRFIIEQSDDEFYTSHSGLALVGLCVNRYSDLSRVTGSTMNKLGNVISHADLLRSYLGLLCLGKSDYEADPGNLLILRTGRKISICGYCFYYE